MRRGSIERLSLFTRKDSDESNSRQQKKRPRVFYRDPALPTTRGTVPIPIDDGVSLMDALIRLVMTLHKV